MENNENSRGNKMILGIILGVVISAILFGGVYYLNMSNKNKENSGEPATSDKDNNTYDNVKDENNNKDNNQEDNKTDTTKPSNTTKSKVLSGNYFKSTITAVLSKGEVYVEIDKCSNDSDWEKNFCSQVDNLFNSYKEYTFDDVDYETIDPKITWENGGGATVKSKLFGVKLNINGVKNIYSVSQGQAASPKNQGLAIVKDDGSLFVISYLNIANNNLTPKSTGLSNIVKVENFMDSDAIGTKATDKNGKTYTLYDYFK